MKKCLTNNQRTQLHDILTDAGVDPSNTNWTNDGKGWTLGDFDTLELGHCYFVIRPESKEISIKCRPAPDGGIQYYAIRLDWNKTLFHFQRWAKQVGEEVKYVDPWDKYAKFYPPKSLVASNDNSTFSFKEVQQAEIAINELIHYLHENLDCYKEKAEVYDASFQRLIEQAKTGLGKNDWKNQFVGTIIALCIALSLSPDEASKIWNFWMEKVSAIYQLIP